MNKAADIIRTVDILGQQRSEVCSNSTLRALWCIP